MHSKNILHNQKGQGLIEYLIIVAIVAVGSIAVMRVVGGNIQVQFANVAQALGGKESQKKEIYKVSDNMVKKRDFSNFFEGSMNRDDSAKK